MKIYIFILVLLLSSNLLASNTGGDDDCIEPKTNQLEEAIKPLLDSLKSENNKLFKTLFSVLTDIKKLDDVFNEENDKYKLAYTFYILKSFADLEEQTISSEDIKSVLSIIKEKYNFEIPDIALSIIDKIGSIKVDHNRDGSKSIRILSKNGGPISIDLAAIADEEEDATLKLKKFTIQHNAEIRFTGPSQKEYSKEMDDIFGRSTITSKEDLITKNEIKNIQKYIKSPNSELKPISLSISGMRIHFDLKGQSVDQADLRGGAVLPQLKDASGKDRPNFYVGLKNIKYGFLKLNAELPM